MINLSFASDRGGYYAAKHFFSDKILIVGEKNLTLHAKK